MLFNSLSFVIFLPVVFIVYWVLPHKFRWAFLLIASYYFYMSWNPNYVVLILFTTVVSYVSGLLLEKTQNTIHKRIVLSCAAVLCIGVLFFFKYFNFLSESIAAVLGAFAIKINPVTLSLILPVGISFYTFQTLSYVIDVYKGRIRAEHHFGYYATFVSFFPQLVAGPIERPDNLLPQIKTVHRFDYEKATYGLKLMMWGFFKKLCVADVIGVYVDSVYSSIEEHKGFSLLFAVIGFGIQIYCDFSGYSDIAIGTSKLFGIDLMTNFKSPYFSSSIKEFWSRWHISLSTWLRDYVYIPLGGNRCGAFRHSLNLIITFLISGLWHGANWTFVVWGGIHGLAQVIENALFGKTKKKDGGKLKKIVSVVIVYIFCTLAWVFFRADSLSDSVFVLSHLFDGLSNGTLYFANSIGLGLVECAKIAFVVLILSVYDYLSLKMDVIQKLGEQKTVIRWIVYCSFIFVIFLFANVGSNSFIYFQF